MANNFPLFGAGDSLTPEQEDAVDSIVNLPDGEVPKGLGGELVVSGESVDPTSGEHTFDSSINVPQASVNVSDTLAISEATLELAVHDYITDTNATGITSIITDAGSQSLTWQFLGVKSTIAAQPIFNTEFNDNPFSAPLLASATNQTDAVTIKTGAAMNNVRVVIRDNLSGLVLKYIPNRAAVVDGVGGLNLIAGDNRIDFNSDLPDVPASGLFYIGFTPLRQLAGQASTFELEADSVSILGEPSGIPYIVNDIQFITPKTINPSGEVLSPDPRNFYFAKGGDNTKAGTTIENANLTIGESISKVNALVPPSDSSNPSAIIGNGEGSYTEDIDVPEGCLLYAPKTELRALSVAALNMGSNSVANFDGVFNAAFNSDGLVIDGESDITVNSRTLANSGTNSNAIHITGTSNNVFINVQKVVSGGTSGAGIFDDSDGASTTVYNINDMLIQGVGAAGILFSPTDADAQAIINIGAVRATGSSSVGVKVDNGIVTLTINSLKADDAIIIGTGGVLNIIASKVEGDITINGTAIVNTEILEHIGAITVSSVATVTGRIGSTYFHDLMLVDGNLVASGSVTGSL